jgi:hypothetical protein
VIQQLVLMLPFLRLQLLLLLVLLLLLLQQLLEPGMEIGPGTAAWQPVKPHSTASVVAGPRQ